MSPTLTDIDSFHFNDSLTDYHQFSPTRSVSVISTPTRSLVTISPIHTPKKAKKKILKKTKKVNKYLRKTIVTTLIIMPMMIVVIGIIATILVRREPSEVVPTTTKTTTTTTNITMTTYDFTSTPNPFICDKKWIGDGICDDEVNLPKCAFDEGDCCLNEIVDTNCHECICHSDGKRHQMTTTTQMSKAMCASFFVMTSYPAYFQGGFYMAQYFSESPICQENLQLFQEIQIAKHHSLISAYFYQSPDSFVLSDSETGMYQVSLLPNEIQLQDFTSPKPDYLKNSLGQTSASSKNGVFFTLENSNYTYSYSETFIYNGDQWSKGPNYQKALQGGCATFLLDSDDVVYIFGGQDNVTFYWDWSKDVYAYFISEEMYNYVTEMPMPNGLHWHGCTANVDENGNNVRKHSLVQLYCLWSLEPDYGLLTFFILQFAVIAGGCIDWHCNVVINEVWKYSPSKDKWTKITSLPFPNHSFRLVSLENYIYMFGTYIDNYAVSDHSTVYKLKPKVSEKWKKVGNLVGDDWTYDIDFEALVVIPIVKEIELTHKGT